MPATPMPAMASMSHPLSTASPAIRTASVTSTAPAIAPIVPGNVTPPSVPGVTVRPDQR